MKRAYGVKDVKRAECNLEPIKCKFCGSLEVVYSQYVGDATCQECGKWQSGE